MSYYLYILECNNATLYTGITTSPARRFQQHLSGVGAKYTRANKPLKMRALWRLSPSRSVALKCEYAVKRLSHQQKQQLITHPTQLLQYTDSIEILPPIIL